MTAENELGGAAKDKKNPLRWIPFGPGTYGKPPSQDALTHLQELPEKTPADFTPLPPDIMTTIHPKINPT